MCCQQSSDAAVFDRRNTRRKASSHRVFGIKWCDGARTTVGISVSTSVDNIPTRRVRQLYLYPMITADMDHTVT
jgi:hypothetical protein